MYVSITSSLPVNAEIPPEGALEAVQGKEEAIAAAPGMGCGHGVSLLPAVIIGRMGQNVEIELPKLFYFLVLLLLLFF